MYYPQAYHHVQEIQKYNIQDYRPRYVVHGFDITSTGELTLTLIEWNNFKRPSEKSDRCSACASSAVMPSRRQTNPKLAFCRLTIPPVPAVAMVKWRRAGSAECIHSFRLKHSVHFALPPFRCVAIAGVFIPLLSHVHAQISFSGHGRVYLIGKRHVKRSQHCHEKKMTGPAGRGLCHEL